MRHRIILFFCLAFFSPSSAFAQTTCSALPAAHEIRLTGFTRARAVLSVVSEVSGRCLEITADTGDTIAADGVFARIDPTFTALDLETNRINRQQAERQLEYDDQQVKRYRRLVSSRSSARVRLDEMELHRDQSRLTLAGLETEAKRLRERLTRHTVRAPAGWRVIERSVEPDEWVAAGKILARVGDYQTLVVPLALTPAELKSLGQNNIPLILPEEGLKGNGRLYRVSPGFDPVTRKINVEIALNPETLARLHRRQGGVRTEILLQVPDPMRTFIIPAAAVTERFEEHWLTRVNGDKLRVIVLGPASAPDGDNRKWLRVTSAQLKKDDAFLLHHEP